MTVNTQTEYRRSLGDDLAYDAAALANTFGGRIVIVPDVYGKIASAEEAQDTARRAAELILGSVCPDLSGFFDCGTEMTDQGAAAVINVRRGVYRPYFIMDKGMTPEGVSVSRGSFSAPASVQEITEMISETAGGDLESSRSLKQDLTFSQTESIFSSRGDDLSDERKREIGIIGRDGMYTELGRLLSDQCAHSIRIADLTGEENTVLSDRNEIRGSVLKQADDAVKLLRRYNRTRTDQTEMFRRERRDYPAEALREALLNAVIHRDYSQSSPIIIRILFDRTEIVSPGGIPGGLSLDDIMLGVMSARNPALTEVFTALGFTESYGSGILRIMGSYAETGHDPVINATYNAFRVTLPNINTAALDIHSSGHHGDASAAADNRYLKGISLAEKKGRIVRKDLQEELGVSQATAILILRDLTSRGLLRKEGDGRNTSYIIGRDE